MFDISAHSKEEQGESGHAIKMSESRDQNIICCPPVLAGMSHEMRTEMNAIVAFTFLLNKKEYGDDDREEFSKHIYNSCEKIISLFDNFLDFAIIETGNSKSDSGISTPVTVLNNLFSEFSELLNKERYKDLILVSESRTFHSSEYIIDMNSVTRVIRNLFRNALFNTNSGYIKLGYEFKNDEFTFYILDSGQGYFKCKEFLQGNDMTLSLKKFNDICTAVNLALTQKLVRIMGGSIRIECNNLTGCGIYFSVPVSKVDNAEDSITKFSNTMSAS